MRQLTDRNHPSKHKQHIKHSQHTRLVRAETVIMSDVTVMGVKSKEQFNLVQNKNYSWYFLLKQRETLRKLFAWCIKYFFDSILS